MARRAAAADRRDVHGYGVAIHAVELEPPHACDPPGFLPVDGDRVTVRWDSDPPAASAHVELTNGLAGHACHVPAGAPAVLDRPPNAGTVYINAFTEPSITETVFGDVVYRSSFATSSSLTP